MAIDWSSKIDTERVCYTARGATDSATDWVAVTLPDWVRGVTMQNPPGATGNLLVSSPAQAGTYDATDDAVEVEPGGSVYLPLAENGTLAVHHLDGSGAVVRAVLLGLQP